MKHVPKNMMQKFARQVRQRNYASDKWFQKMWKKHGMLHHNDQFNSVIGPTIPDLMNHRFKYIVECDDPSHLLPARKKKDKEKTRYWKNKGYKVFRVKAFSEKAILNLKPFIMKLRKGENSCQTTVKNFTHVEIGLIAIDRYERGLMTEQEARPLIEKALWYKQMFSKMETSHERGGGP